MTVQAYPGLREITVNIRVSFHGGVVHLQHVSMKTLPLFNHLPPEDPGFRFQTITLCTSSQPTVIKVEQEERSTLSRSASKSSHILSIMAEE
jgi:hypothetical protein